VEMTIISLREAVIQTIAFFDLFDYPLTPLEILSDIKQTARLQDIRNICQFENSLEEKEGFFFLKGRQEIVETRKKRHNYSARKIIKAKRFAALFGLFPGVEMVALANSIGHYNLRDDSDIDFFIITKPGFLWLSRLYCTGLAKILISRPTDKTKRDKACLSFYLSKSMLSISSLRLSGNDPYFDRWHQQLVLLYNKNETYQHFLKANSFDKPTNTEVTPLLRLGFFEKFARALQLKIMPEVLKSAAGNSDGVVISNQVLKFYKRDRRREFEKKYVQKIATLFSSHS